MTDLGRRRGILFLLLAALACEHSDPFATTTQLPLGPPSTSLPRRLTFNLRADITPSVAGDTLVYTRVDADRADGDGCLAFLPLDGGTLYRTACARGARADSVRDSWLHAAVSPDGRRVAFVRERLIFRAGSLLERTLVVAPLGAPDSASVVVDGYVVPGGAIRSGYRRITWVDDQTLRFLGGVETGSAGAVDGFDSAAVFAVALTRTPGELPAVVSGLEDVVTYAPGDDGAVYFVPRDSTVVYRATADAPAEPVARFSGDSEVALLGLTDLAVSDGVVAVIGIFLYPETGAVPRLVVADLAGDRSPSVVPLVARPDRLAGVPGRGQVVVESQGDLWLVPIRSGSR